MSDKISWIMYKKGCKSSMGVSIQTHCIKYNENINLDTCDPSALYVTIYLMDVYCISLYSIDVIGLKGKTLLR